jgi:hypothetical protein
LWVLEKRGLHLWTRVWTMHTQRPGGRMRQWDSTARYRSLSTGKTWNNTIPVRNRRIEGRFRLIPPRRRSPAPSPMR